MQTPTESRRPYWTSIAACIVAAFYLITSMQIAARRLLWFDEIGTVLMARLPSASRILAALSKWDNNMPALYFLVVHWFMAVLGGGAVAARLPSALGMTAGLLIVFDCTRRLTDGVHGLIAMGVLACSCLPYFGYEARSYGIYFLLVSLCFWLWVHGKRKMLSAVLFGAAFYLAIMFHYYAVLVLVPYAAWEALGWKRLRMPSAKLTAGGLAVLAAVATLLPQMTAFWSPPTLFKLRTTFDELFPDGLFLLALILIWVVIAARNRKEPVAPPMEAAEGIGWLGFLIPLAGYVAARFVTNAYVSRYFLGLLPGVAVAFACWSWRHFRETPLVPAGILVILAGFGLQTQLSTLRHPESIDPYHQQTETRQALALENTLRAEGKRFVLLDNGMLYQELWFHSKHPEQYVLLVPSDRYLQTHNTTRYSVGLGNFFPMQFWNTDDVCHHASETALVQPNEEVWKILEQAGVKVQRRVAGPMEVDYLQ
jgi:hypothetical protein